MDSVYGAPGDEFGATLFVTYHLGELDVDYWLKHTGTDIPDARQVLRLLELRVDTEEEAELDVLDFTLPEGATDYIISVDFDDAGNAVAVTTES